MVYHEQTIPAWGVVIAKRPEYARMSIGRYLPNAETTTWTLKQKEIRLYFVVFASPDASENKVFTLATTTYGS